MELTIRYKTFEWSFSSAESDFRGHLTDSEDSKRPHYHFQMRVNGQAFIRFNDFHAPFSNDDIVFIEAERIAPETLQRRYSGAPGMSELLRDDIIEQVVMRGTTDVNKEDAPLNLDTITIANDGTKISGDKIADLFEEAKRKKVTMTSLIRDLPNVSVQVIVTPGPGVVEQTPRSGGRKKKKRR